VSQEVDLSTPLTRAEREYLLARGRYGDVERADSQFGGYTPDELLSGDGTGTHPVSVLTSDQAADRKRRLLEELAAIEAAEGATTEAPADEDEELKPYEDMTVPELDAELKARSLSTAGKQAEKVARLHKDDEDNAASA
jgi:hypothetical protein